MHYLGYFQTGGRGPTKTEEYEVVYPHEYGAVSKARQSLGVYFQPYKTEWLQQSLGYRTLYKVYFGSIAASDQVEAGV